MSDDDDRAILREHGEDPPQRGRLAPKWKTLADDYRQGPPAEGEDTYDGGVNPETDFGPDVTEAAEPPPLPPERKPRKVRAPRKSLADRMRTGQGKAGAKKRHPRVPVDRLIGRAWEMMGGLAGRVDVPLGRCLSMQAPVAGLIMEDLVKGTYADRALQPIARAEEKAEKGLALLAPPLCVIGLEVAQTLPEEQRKLREAILWPLLVESMVLWDRIAGDKAEEIIERATADAPSRKRAEELASLMFASPPGGPVTPEPEPAEASA